jgi:hypothetical protein
LWGEMTRDEIDPQYSDDIDLLVEESDEALEGTCGGLMRGFSTLAYGFVTASPAAICIQERAEWI